MWSKFRTFLSRNTKAGGQLCPNTQYSCAITGDECDTRSRFTTLFGLQKSIVPVHANVAKFDSNVVKGGGIFGDISTENKYTTQTVWWRKGAWEGLVARKVHQVTRHPREVVGVV